MYARDIMTADVVWITAHHSLCDAFATMMQFNVNHLPVVDNQTVVGLISKREVFTRAVAGGSRGDNVSVGDAMLTNIFTCVPHHPVSKIIEAMSRFHLDAIPVLNKKELAGIITATDILHYTLAANMRIA